MRGRFRLDAMMALALGIPVQPGGRYRDPREKDLREVGEKPAEAAPEEMRKPLLTGRRGKGSRRSRKGGA